MKGIIWGKWIFQDFIRKVFNVMELFYGSIKNGISDAN